MRYKGGGRENKEMREREREGERREEKDRLSEKERQRKREFISCPALIAAVKRFLKTTK